MTTDPTTLRIPPAIRHRLAGIEAELRPTPGRVPLRAPSADGRPTLYLVDGRVASRVRPTPVRPARKAPARGFGAVAVVAAVVAVVGLGGMLGLSGGSGPAASTGSSVAVVTPAASTSVTATASMALLAPSNLPPLAPTPDPFPSLVDIQVIRVAADPATAATRFLRTTCVTKVPSLDQVVVKRLLTTALAAKVTAGWVDQSRTMFVAPDDIDAAQAFGAIVLIEGPGETWAIARDGTSMVALHLESMATIKDRQAWWTSLTLRPTACP